MRKLCICLFLLLFIQGVIFAEFQFEPKFGYFYEKNTYEKNTSRSFDGFATNIFLRVLFSENVGIFGHIGFYSWSDGDNRDYIKQFESAGISTQINDVIGTKLNLGAGIAFVIPVNEKFNIRSDLGISYIPWGTEGITGTMTYNNVSTNVGIFIEPFTSFGFMANIFGSIELFSRGHLTLGANMDFKINRSETTEFIAGGISTRTSDNPKFFGFTIAPTVGMLFTF
ncbi:MAG: hypothetical protein FWD22_03950 [Treponema sp.]|nr:hypothetical protein [Treponema sp.]